MSTSTCILISTRSSSSTPSNSTSTRIIIPLHLTNVSLFDAHIASVNLVVHIYMWPGSIWCPRYWNATQELQDSICAVLTFPVDILLPIKVIPILSIWDFLWPTPIWLLWVVVLGETWQIRWTMSFIAPLRISTSRIAYGEIFFTEPKALSVFLTA